jgi:L-asparaginase / beta-aspartyl-peptidase
LKPSILVHGGAGALAPTDDASAKEKGCLAAARAGHAVLRAGGTALEAVLAAIVILEDDPNFNAGLGSSLNRDGDVECDASLMEGSGRAGAVGAVREVKNPILLAQAVLATTSHVLLVGQGAEALAHERGLTFVPKGALVTPVQRAAWETATAKGHGTVGAVAVDAEGHVAAGTSTGGMAMKRPGRLGDSPLIGCGTYALEGAGACSCTGTGEAIIKAVLAKTAVDRLNAGALPEDAARAVLPQLERFGGEGGLILVDGRGRLGMAFSTERMARAWVDGEGAEGAGFR